MMTATELTCEVAAEAGAMQALLLPTSEVMPKRIRLDKAVGEGFDALLDPAGIQLKILIDLA